MPEVVINAVQLAGAALDNGDNPERTSIFMNQVPSSLAARPYLMGGGGEGGSSS